MTRVKDKSERLLRVVRGWLRAGWGPVGPRVGVGGLGSAGSPGRKWARGRAPPSQHGAGSCHTGEQYQPKKLQMPKRREHNGRRKEISPEVSQARDKPQIQTIRKKHICHVCRNKNPFGKRASPASLGVIYFFFLNIV